ncbi:fungal-specific transcription factor domain-containing protein [Abortiporus biennis]|nr:fungal-specific transcription factor domain-containing protein [Abortiporus biennis]
MLNIAFVRLKLKCSRVFPCASCVKKGCAAICPDGSLTTGKGNRFVLANTEVLHEKISVLSNRVRQLEDALHEAHSARSQDPHPLLTPDLLQLKRPLERESADIAHKEPDAETAEAIDAVGSLSITESGHTNFFGITANAWYLLQIEQGRDEEDTAQVPLPSDIPWLSHTFPFNSNPTETISEVRLSLTGFLPDINNARRLSELYYRHAAWMYTPLPETEFYTSIFPRFYEQQQYTTEQDQFEAHRLAIMFMIFALGSLLDLERPALSAEATQFYQLARAALSLDSILESQSIPAVQALILMCHYMFLSFIEGPRWALMGIAVKLAQSIGLHRDSEKWNLAAEETYRRRSLLWELYTYDAWQSLTFGRPPSFSTAFIDCQMSENTTRTEQGEVEMNFAAWKHRFSSRCLSVVQEQAFGARSPSYKTIQDLDKKVRNFYVPPSLRVPGFGGARVELGMEPPPIQLTMQRYIAFAIKEISIFYLHRGFFAKAVEDHPEDPLGSKYAPSFLAAYNSACSFVGLVKSLYSQHPGLTIVLGSIPTKCPGMALARSALSHLESACSLFEEVSENARAAQVVPVLRKLKGRAVSSMSDLSTGGSPSMPSDDQFVKDEDDELATLGGRTRLVPRKSPSAPSSPQAMFSNSDPNHSNHSYDPGMSYQANNDNIPFISPVVTQQPQSVMSQHWQQQSYSPETFDYYPAPSSLNHWQHEQDFVGDHDNSGMTGIQYPLYGHVPSMMNRPFSSHEQQPLDSPVQNRATDPDASWRSLFAQFNQA